MSATNDRDPRGRLSVTTAICANDQASLTRDIQRVARSRGGYRVETVLQTGQNVDGRPHHVTAFGWYQVHLIVFSGRGWGKNRQYREAGEIIALFKDGKLQGLSGTTAYPGGPVVTLQTSTFRGCGAFVPAAQEVTKQLYVDLNVCDPCALHDALTLLSKGGSFDIEIGAGRAIRLAVMGRGE